MNYVFGRAFVCKDASTARAVAFDKNVFTNCVTVEGDLLNPSGLLTGGSRNNSHSVLAKLHALHEAEKALGELKNRRERSVRRREDGGERGKSERRLGSRR